MRPLVLVLLVVSLVLLIPGLFAPVLTIRGVLTRDGIAQVAPQMLQHGLDDDTLNALKTMMNPTVVALLDATGGMEDVEVFQQTRSIVGSVRRLYEVGSPRFKRRGPDRRPVADCHHRVSGHEQ